MTCIDFLMGLATGLIAAWAAAIVINPCGHRKGDAAFSVIWSD